MTEKSKIISAIAIYIILAIGIFFALDVSESVKFILFIVLLVALGFTKHLIKKKTEATH